MDVSFGLILATNPNFGIETSSMLLLLGHIVEFQAMHRLQTGLILLSKVPKARLNRNHKKICKKLVALNKQKGYAPSAGRRWGEYYDEQVHYSSHLARRTSRF
ncbi:hypothetical protein GGP41_010120 [Bipolaris sorokiniana]|uniref:Uncharacterized protein n=1 Tax=Cochliobolus sativus TaxID=45130 RepID=A0A8H5ZHT4_COCSA|nr:hypothetical protein GGP41_010120 [Bipolaris sorokiniana]